MSEVESDASVTLSRLRELATKMTRPGIYDATVLYDWDRPDGAPQTVLELLTRLEQLLPDWRKAERHAAHAYEADEYQLGISHGIRKCIVQLRIALGRDGLTGKMLEELCVEGERLRAEMRERLKGTMG